MFMEHVTGLHFMQRNNNILEEYYMLFSQRNCKTWDDTGQNIQKLRSSIKFISLMNETIKTVVDCFSNHFSSWNQFGIQSMQNIFQVLSFSRLLRIEKLKEFLNERRCDMNF